MFMLNMLRPQGASLHLFACLFIYFSYAGIFYLFIYFLLTTHAQVRIASSFIHHSVGSQWVLVHLVSKRLLDISSQQSDFEES